MSGSRYESFRVATLGLVITWMRLKVIREGAESSIGFPRWSAASNAGSRRCNSGCARWL